MFAIISANTHDSNALWQGGSGPSVLKAPSSTVGSATVKSSGPEETKLPKPVKKPKKFVRAAGGTVWQDDSLLEWDPSKDDINKVDIWSESLQFCSFLLDDYRIFCGDLGNDVTDEVLARVFGKFPSFQKAKVVRDKRSNKSKGFGFVSFKDPVDFTRAMKEMNGKIVYILELALIASLTLVLFNGQASMWEAGLSSCVRATGRTGTSKKWKNAKRKRTPCWANGSRPLSKTSFSSDFNLCFFWFHDILNRIKIQIVWIHLIVRRHNCHLWKVWVCARD